MKTNRRNAVAALVAAGLLWGTTVPLSKLALYWLSPGWLTVVRFGLAAAVLLAAAARRGTGLRAAFTPAVLVAGAFGYGGSVMLQNAGISRTSVTHAALLIGAVPVLVAIIAAAWYRTVARPVAWFGFVVSLAGVGLVTAGGGGGGATLAGDGLVLASLFLSATVTVAQGRLLDGRDPVAVTAVQFLGATLGALPVAVITEGAPAVPGGAGPVLAVVALAGLGTLAPFTLFAFGQSRVSAEVAGAFLNLEPLVGAIAGAVAFGDPVGAGSLVGGVAILAGIGLSSLPLFAVRRAEMWREAVGAGAGAEALAPAGVEAPGALVPVGPEVSLVPAGAEAPGALGPVDAEAPGTGAPGAGAPGADAPGHGCDTVLNRRSRLPHPYNPGARRERRDGVFVVVRGGKFGPGGGPNGVADGRPGAGRPRGNTRPTRSRPGGSRSRPGGSRSRPGGSRSRPGGSQPGGPGRRPPVRRRASRGTGPGASGRRPTGGRPPSWPGASTGRAAAGR